jgi:hypothetical protein
MILVKRVGVYQDMLGLAMVLQLVKPTRLRLDLVLTMTIYLGRTYNKDIYYKFYKKYGTAARGAIIVLF